MTVQTLIDQVHAALVQRAVKEVGAPPGLLSGWEIDQLPHLRKHQLSNVLAADPIADGAEDWHLSEFVIHCHAPACPGAGGNDGVNL